MLDEADEAWQAPLPDWPRRRQGYIQLFEDTDTATMQRPANDNEDPDVVLAKKIARVLSLMLAAGLLIYLLVTYVLPS